MSAPKQSTGPFDCASPLCVGDRLITIARDPRDFKSEDAAAEMHAYVGSNPNVRAAPDSNIGTAFISRRCLTLSPCNWLTNSGASSSRLYWEGVQAGGGPFDAVDIPEVPVGVTVFPAEIYRPPRIWGERAFDNLIYWHEADKGGHFAAWETAGDLQSGAARCLQVVA